MDPFAEKVEALVRDIKKICIKRGGKMLLPAGNPSTRAALKLLGEDFDVDLRKSDATVKALKMKAKKAKAIKPKPPKPEGKQRSLF